MSTDRFIIGIDLGTTYSAAAWALFSDRKIEVIRNWPTSGQPVGAKVPTEIAYPVDPSDPSAAISWGYDISPRNRKVKWFKLQLEDEQHGLTLPAGMDAIEVAKDYLRELHAHVMSTLERRFNADIIRNAKFDYVLTVPAIWSDMAKKRTELAAIKAGLGGANSSLELLSEPESAAIYSLKTIENVLARIKVGDKIVVCDAGGGTVDLVSYDLKQITPTLQVAECTTGTGDFCGASFIDRAFDVLFRKRMGDSYESLSPVHRQQVVKNFELCKLAFRDDPARRIFYVNVPTVSNIQHAGVIDGEFEITRDEMRALFDPVVNDILGLIEEQINMASAETGQVNAILLVGGFGESEYLYMKVKAWAKTINVDVLQPRDAATAVVQGAVLKGMEPKVGPGKTQVARRARISYGVPTKENFVEGRHLEVDAEYDEHTGKKLARNQIRWFIRTNQLVSDDEVVTYKFRRRFKHLTYWEDSLVSSTLPTPPTRMDSYVHKHCTIRSDLTQLDLKQDFEKHRHRFSTFYLAEYDLVISLKNNNLNLSLLYRGNRYGIAHVEFEALSG